MQTPGTSQGVRAARPEPVQAASPRAAKSLCEGEVQREPTEQLGRAWDAPL